LNEEVKKLLLTSQNQVEEKKEEEEKTTVGKGSTILTYQELREKASKGRRHRRTESKTFEKDFVNNLMSTPL
jgi:hypothetical protein